MRTLTASGVLVSGGNFNHFTSHVVRQLMENGELVSYVAHLRASYAARAEAMDLALRTHLSGVARWQNRLAGISSGSTAGRRRGAGTLQDAARAAGTGFLPGAACCTSGGLKNCLRLSFAHYSVSDIHEGIARLRRVLR